MQAQRTIYKVENNYLKLELSLDFESSFVEVIILPYQPENVEKKDTLNDKNQLSEFQQLLLQGPIMDDEDFNYFNEKRNHFNQWK